MDNRVASQALSQERVISSSVRVRIVDMRGLQRTQVGLHLGYLLACPTALRKGSVARSLGSV